MNRLLINSQNYRTLCVHIVLPAASFTALLSHWSLCKSQFLIFTFPYICRDCISAIWHEVTCEHVIAEDTLKLLSVISESICWRLKLLYMCTAHHTHTRKSTFFPFFFPFFRFLRFCFVFSEFLVQQKSKIRKAKNRKLNILYCLCCICVRIEIRYYKETVFISSTKQQQQQTNQNPKHRVIDTHTPPPHT